MVQIESRHHRCIISVLLLIVLLVLLLVTVIGPWWARMSEYDDQAASMAERIGRYQRLIDSKADLRAELAGFRQQQVKRGYFLNAGSRELAAAELQKRVKELVAPAGGTLVSTQTITQSNAADDGKVVVRVRMKGGVDSLSAVLHAIESDKPLMFVENLTVRSRKTVRGRRGARKTVYNLDVNFDLASYLLGGAG